MPFHASKSAADIPVKVIVKKYTISNQLSDFHSDTVSLSSKIGELMVRIGDANQFCFNIIIQLLTKGKVRVDFRDISERLQLVNKHDVMNREEALVLFDDWVKENRVITEDMSSTRKIVLELPRAKLPRAI